MRRGRKNNRKSKEEKEKKMFKDGKKRNSERIWRQKDLRVKKRIKTKMSNIKEGRENEI
jgi:hypothetical protein